MKRKFTVNQFPSTYLLQKMWIEKCQAHSQVSIAYFLLKGQAKVEIIFPNPVVHMFFSENSGIARCWYKILLDYE